MRVRESERERERDEVLCVFFDLSHALYSFLPRQRLKFEASVTLNKSVTPFHCNNNNNSDSFLTDDKSSKAWLDVEAIFFKTINCNATKHSKEWDR